MTLLFEFINDFLEFICEKIHTFKVVLCQGIKLLNIWEDFNQFLESAHKGIKFSENLCFWEIKSLSLWHVCNLVLSVSVALFVFAVKFNARAKYFNKFSWILFPNLFVISVLVCILLHNSFLAILDHLICDFNEKASHLVCCIIESGYCVNHFNSIHESWQSINDLLRSSMVQRFNKLFQSCQILHIVLCFVELIS